MKIITAYDYDAIDKFRQKIEVSLSDKSIFYRGTKINFLLPSLIPFSNKLNAIQLARIEDKLLEEFKFYYTEKIDESDISTNDWFFRIKAREHGLSSRLMDWSHTFYKALDFATYNVGMNVSFRYVYLWILVIEPEEILNLEDYKNHSFKNLDTTFLLRNVIPATHINFLASRRQFIQGGSFLVQPTHWITYPINEQPFFKDKLICIQIPIENVNAIRQDIIKKAGEDIEKSVLIEKNKIDLICKKLNNDYLYSINNLLLD